MIDIEPENYAQSVTNEMEKIVTIIQTLFPNIKNVKMNYINQILVRIM